MNWKPIKITTSGHKKVRLLNEKNNERRIDEEILQLYCLVEKATEKLMNSICNIEELDYEKSFNINQEKLKENFIIWTN